MGLPKGMTVLESGIHEGIEWAVGRAPIYQAANGYVRIPEGHIWHGLAYSDVPVNVHGGLTYGGPEWYGFDTLHGWDWWPAMAEWRDIDDRAHHWTVDAVAAETKRLAEQVARASEDPSVAAWRKATS